MCYGTRSVDRPFWCLLPPKQEALAFVQYPTSIQAKARNRYQTLLELQPNYECGEGRSREGIGMDYPDDLHLGGREKLNLNLHCTYTVLSSLSPEDVRSEQVRTSEARIHLSQRANPTIVVDIYFVSSSILVKHRQHLWRLAQEGLLALHVKSRFFQQRQDDEPHHGDTSHIFPLPTRHEGFDKNNRRLHFPLRY